MKVPELPVKNIVMWHTVAHVDVDNKVCGVEITTDPYDHKAKAAIILHRSRSKNVATQVSRFVRRATGVERVTIHRANTPRDARLGYAVSTTMQYEPNERTPCQDLVLLISSTSVKDLLAQSDGQNNAARTRYFVLEIRDGEKIIGRFVSNKTHSVERMWREAPPDLAPRSELFTVGKFADRADALACAEEANGSEAFDYRKLWTRLVSPDYMRKVVEIVDGELVFVRTKKPACRIYTSGAMVIVGPHSYTKRQIMGVIQHGAWLDARTNRST